MAVPEQTPYIEHAGNGVTTSFSLGFQCESKDHLIVLVDEIEPPIASWSLFDGNVVFTTAPASGSKITLQRNTPFSRTTDYQSYNNSFRPPAVNKDFDWIWLKLQELGVADWLMKLYVDQLHQQQEQKINDLKGYVDDRDDELRAYLMEEIRKQGVALDQLDDYYNYLMQRLAQIAVDKGWDASFVVDASGENQQQVNDKFKESLNNLVDTTVHAESFKNLVDASGFWDEAIKAAINKAITSTKLGLIAKVKLPRGVLTVTNPSVFTYNSAVSKRGLLVEGEGRYSSVIYIVTEGTEKWVYNNGVGNPKFDIAVFKDIGFTSDNAALGNGFKIWSAGHEKAFVFDKVAYGNGVNQAVGLDTTVGGINQGWHFWGTGNADQTDWYSPVGQTNGATITLENNQSVNFNIYGGTQITLGSFINVKGSGGGEFNMYGSHITTMQKAGDTNKYWFLDIDDGVNLASGNDRYNFNGIRFEHRNLNTGLVKYNGDLGSLNCNFDECNSSGVYLTSEVEAVRIGAQKKVIFNGGNLNERHLYNLTSTNLTYANGGVIGFNDVMAGIASGTDKPLYNRITIAGVGRSYGRNVTYNGNYNYSINKVSDFDIGESSNPRMGSRVLKVAHLKPKSATFPSANASAVEYTLELPVGSFIKGVYVERPAGGTGSYQLFVGNNDKSVIYGQSILGTAAEVHKIDVINVNKLVTASNQIIRFWAGGDSTVLAGGGIVLIEYY